MTVFGQELLLYLLQLVQAVRYEDVEKMRTALGDLAMTTGVMQDTLDDALTEGPEPDPDPDPAELLTPELNDSADINAELMNSALTSTSQSGEVNIHPPPLLAGVSQYCPSSLFTSLLTALACRGTVPHLFLLISRWI